MNFNMNGIFEELLPHLPGVLASSDALAGIRAVNERLPAGLTTRGGIECHLGISEAKADWQLCINGEECGRDMIAGKLPTADLDNSLFDDRRWRQIRIFVKNWADPSTEFNEKIRHIWLEFDQDNMKDRAPVPGVFFNVMNPSQSPPGASMKPGGGNGYGWVADAVRQLQSEPLRKEINDRLQSCFDALPDGSEVDYAASMISRNQDAARIVISLGREVLQDYLAGIEYAGSIQEVMELTEEMGQFARLRYIFDIADTVLPKVGIECFIDDKQGNNKAASERFLEHLVARSLCIPEKRDALLSWPGHTRAFLPNELWPCYIFRGISHVKILCRNKRPLEAKGYLRFHRRFTMDIINDLESAGDRG